MIYSLQKYFHCSLSQSRLLRRIIRKLQAGLAQRRQRLANAIKPVIDIWLRSLFSRHLRHFQTFKAIMKCVRDLDSALKKEFTMHSSETHPSCKRSDVREKKNSAMNLKSFPPRFSRLRQFFSELIYHFNNSFPFETRRFNLRENWTDGFNFPAKRIVCFCSISFELFYSTRRQVFPHCRRLRNAAQLCHPSSNRNANGSHPPDSAFCLVSLGLNFRLSRL